VTSGTGASGATTEAVNSRALEGVRVLELSIAVAAPSCGRALAYHGAEVLKVESPTAPDVVRLFGSAWARTAELAHVFGDTGPYVTEMSTGKRSVGLDLKKPEALDAALRLVANCDVFLTNYSSPAVAGLGLGYEAVRAVKEDIVYVAMPGFGSDPDWPYYSYVGWGPNQAPLVGLDALTGYPDQEPAGIATIAPPDYVAGLHAALAVLSGLEHRDRTGEGVFVDIAQFETTVSLLGPLLFDHALSGHTAERAGNRVPWAAPQGVYPTYGNDQHVAITVDDEEAWALGAVAGSPDWARDPRFADAEGRWSHHDEIDAHLAGWAARHTAEELATWLQDAGVAAYPVHDNAGVAADPQVRSRRWFHVRPSTRFPAGDLFSGYPTQLSATPGSIDVGGPAFAEHTREALTELAGLGSEEVDALVAAAAAFEPVDPGLALHRPYERFLDAFGFTQPQHVASEGDQNVSSAGDQNVSSAGDQNVSSEGDR
jgi:benzylsuccinate CoA-transferase BbsF subunit